MLSCGKRALTGQFLAGCLWEGKVDQWIVKLVSSFTFELAWFMSRSISQVRLEPMEPQSR
ncbi:hypothetical protein NL64_16400 [Pseudomonas fluorescens]|nr:hypothetical protein NL64_16400 [Pseudomonas fluorescens]